MKEIVKKWLPVLLPGIGILILGIILRLYHLTLLPIFADEAIYIRWAQVMRAEPSLRFLPLSDGKQPLFMWLVIPFLKVFSDPLYAGRFVSALAGAATLVGVFVLSYYLFKSHKVALISSFLYAVSPFSVFFDRMALVDSLLTMFGVWTLIFAVLTARTLRLDFAMLAGFALGGALLTKSPAIFYVILLPATALILSWPFARRKGEIFIHLTKLVSLWLVILVIAYALYNILRLGPNFHLIGARNQDYVFPLSHLWTNPKDPFIFHFDRAVEWISMLGPLPVLLLAILGVLVNLKNKTKEIAIVATWFLFPILVQSEFAKVFTARYILFSIPYLFILAASSFLSEGKKEQVMAKLGFVFFIAYCLWIDYALLTNPEKAPLPRSERSGYLEEWTAGTGIKEVSQIIKREAGSTDKKIIVGTEGYFGTLPDGLQIYFEGDPRVTVIGVGLGINRVPESLMDSAKAGNKTYLVINSSRLLLKDPQSQGLKLIAQFPKAERPDGIKEYVAYGPRDFLYLFEVTGLAVRQSS